MGTRVGNWLTAEQGHALWQAPDRQKRKRDRGLARIAACVWVEETRNRGSEIGSSPANAQNTGPSPIWSGKGGHVRTVPVSDWVRTELDDWIAVAAIDRGRLFRAVNKVPS